MLEDNPSKITAKCVQKALENKFDKAHIYTNNMYLYNEESDFLSISKDRYAHEFEIKISRSDFKADFKKNKHREMSSIINNLEMVVIPGKEILHSSIDVLMNHYENFIYTRKYDMMMSGDDARKRNWIDVKPSFRETICGCSIEIRKLDPKYLPNKFSFIVPEGLVSKEEVPNYAGLFYIDKWHSIKEIKRAPFLHKKPFDRWEDLCLKFYHRNKYR